MRFLWKNEKLYLIFCCKNKYTDKFYTFTNKNVLENMLESADNKSEKSLNGYIFLSSTFTTS